MVDDPIDSVADVNPDDREDWMGDPPSRWWTVLPYRRIKIVASIIAFLLLLSFLVWYLLRPYNRTPIIAVQTGTYEWPFTPHAWVWEDIAKLHDLGDASNKYAVAINVKSVLLKDATLTGLNKIPTDKRWGQAIIIYISMHGAVRNGKPFLVPAGTSTDEDGFSVSNVLRNIDKKLGKVGKGKLKLVVLDCSRMPLNPYLGWLQNDFAGALQTWWKSNDRIKDKDNVFKDFAILSAAGPGERSWTSSALKGSVFGHYFCKGMAGGAGKWSWLDLRSSVTLNQLTDYLRGNVNRWVVANRADRQTPLLLFADENQKNFVLASSSSTSKEPDDDESNSADSQKPENDSPKSAEPSKADDSPKPGDKSKPDKPSDNVKPRRSALPDSLAANVRREERMKLWTSLEELRAAGLYRFDPLGWRNLEHQLLWLDQLADAGAEYKPLCQSTLSKLQIQLRDIQDRQSRAQHDRSISKYVGVVSGESDVPTNLRLPSLPLSEFIGTLPSTVVSTARTQLQRFQSTPSQRQLAELQRDLERAGLNEFAEAQFAQMLDRYQFSAMWQNSAGLGELMALRSPERDYGVPGAAGGMLGDERVHGLVRGLVEKADDARRNVEDVLFVDQQPEFARKLAIAKETAASAGTAMTTFQNAIKLRDQVWAELPYLAIWHASILRPSSKKEIENSEKELENLEKAIATTRELDAKIASSANADPADVANTVSAIGTLSVRLDKEFKVVKNEQFLANCIGIQNKGDAVEWRQLEAALAIPLLNLEIRSKLDAQFSKLSGSELAKTAAPEKTFVADGKVWSSLREVGISLQRDIAAAKEGKATRQDWSRLDDRLRSVAALTYRNPKSERELGLPVPQLRKIDLRALVMWHADRALRDFWGPADDKKVPFFERSANAYLGALSPAAEPEPSDVAALRAKVAKEVAASRNWLKTQASNALLLETDSSANTRIAVSSGSKDVPTVAGTAAVYVQKDDQRLENVGYYPAAGAALPIRQHEATASIPGKSISLKATNREQVLDAMTMFRGHEFRGQFHVDPLGGVVVDDRPHTYGPGRVTLRSPWRGLSVVVVLDCSQSMDEPLENGKTKLTVAKEALVELLSALSSKLDSHVGVRLFGHRLGWSTDRPVRVLTSPTYAGAIPAELTPDGDVERLLPLGNFDFKSAQVVFTALRGVEHGWGQSPVFLALNRTLTEDFANADVDTKQHVIVITDGRNYQVRPTSAEQVSESQVVQSARSARVPIHVLAFAPAATEAQQDATVLTNLADQTGGTRETITGSKDLRRTLQALVQPELDQLTNAEGRVVDRGMLGQPLSDGGQHPAWYSVSYEDKADNIFLTGGEAIELYAKQGDKQLYAFPFDHDVAGESWLRSASGEGDLIVERVHRPLGAEHNAEFRISLQRCFATQRGEPSNMWRWTPRPREAWIEVVPLTADRKQAGQTYLFYDANYLPDQPVPLLEIVAKDWPHGIDRARISAWYKNAPSEHSMRLPLSLKEKRFADSALQVDSDFVDSAPGTPKLYRVRVIERRLGPVIVQVDTKQNGPKSAANWLKVVPPATATAGISRIVRQFDERHGVAVHTFFYANPDDESLAQLNKIGIDIVTPQVALADATWVPPVEVNISSSGELLPLSGGSARVASAKDRGSESAP